ncbi:MAG: hypothetical protein F6J98_28435 [Moorea sp. SIO4G2]|nr:hypothetical protein [Moorena sp. SIO4G2]
MILTQLFLPTLQAIYLQALTIPDSRFPIPDSRFPVPDSRFPIPYSLIQWQ